MTIEEYSARFDLFCEEAKHVSRFFRLEEYQRRLSALSGLATDFYRIHAVYGEPDYQRKIDLFVAFDGLLKELIRTRSKPRVPVTKSVSFFSFPDAASPQSDASSPSPQ